jgi:uncharacterized membrane protein YoaK (UPF0700 family)
MSTTSRLLRSSAYRLHGSPDVARLQSHLPPLLSTVAGMVDVIGYLSLGKLFTAHVTGNIVVIAALLVRGGPPNIAQILAVPIFIVAVGGVWLIAKGLDTRGRALIKPLLVIQFVLLASVLIVSVVYAPAASPHGLMAGVAAMLAVCAMASQFALLRLALPGAPSTAVMTGNLTGAVLSVLDTISQSNEPLMQGSRDRLKKTSAALAGFFGGCMAGAAAVSWLGNWAWSLPVVLAGAAVALLPRGVGE